MTTGSLDMNKGRLIRSNSAFIQATGYRLLSKVKN